MPLPRHLAALSLVVLAACGGGGGGGADDAPPPAPPPEGRPVASGPFETYTTQHNGFSRVRSSTSQPGDARVLAAFDDADPTDPAGYRDLIARSEADRAGRMTIEVIAEVDPQGGNRATRLLRLTADQAPFENLRDGELVAASGQYFFKGQSFAWVTIDDGPLLSGRHSDGLENLMLDFDRGTANIDIRTEVSPRSQVEIGLRARNLPFNVVTGAYGGDTVISVRNPDAAETFRIDGQLRGNVGGSPTYRNDRHGMTTSGLYTATGRDKGHAVTVDGAYTGVDPNARR
ncbi:viral aspartic protease [Paracoccus liaowanqingii]|uniref:Viral aspartic protease n=1 Tax=Paracoccus liaowanqingii TaxID=2560053 RepID=A0A4Z1C4Z0_9RHOB|nr:viral aspartic protease [Paracoccus liaowanqingii]TGN44430.1 viral aspartic protease [Paracoccus liaowanqingii]